MGKLKNKEDDNVSLKKLPDMMLAMIVKKMKRETLQAGDLIRYTKSNGIAGRRGDLEITEIMSVHPEKEYPLIHEYHLLKSNNDCPDTQQ
eukprot:15358122-Ditylum_brightwellii.AAC.1